MHHTYTNIVGMDRDVGYGILRMSKDQRWSPYFLGNPVYAFLLMVLFQYGVAALHEMETERIRSGEITVAEKRDVLTAIWQKTKKQTLKDYVAFPLLAGPFAPWVFAGNMTANLMRNVWSYMIIFCGHFPEDVQEFSIEETKAETRGGWYFRQILGSANLTGGKLFHILSGNLSFQIEHHLFPDVPAHRHAEIAPEVQEICERYGIPYNKGSLPKQFGTVVRKIVKPRCCTRCRCLPSPSGPAASPKAAAADRRMRFATAMCGSQSGPSRSGPRWATASSSLARSRISSTPRSMPAA